MGEISPSTVALLGIAATLAVAAIAGLSKLVRYALEASDKDRQARFDQRIEVQRLVGEAERRIDLRLDRLDAIIQELRLRVGRSLERSEEGGKPAQRG
jgi:hypothetical protein